MAKDFAKDAVSVAVLGAGIMGRGIAQVAAEGGMPVLMFDTQAGAAERGRVFVAEMFQRASQRGRLPAVAAAAATQRVSVVERLSEIAGADIVIEAVVENLEVKRRLFDELDALLPPATLLASNTSSFRIAAIAAGCRAKGRIAGMHFFNPVPLMRLVEIVAAPATHPDTVAAMLALGSRMGRVPVVVKDGPGFLVNLGGRAFTTEGLRLAQDGIATPAQVDAIMRDACGFRMGPFELMDLTGIDVNFPASVAIWQGYFQDPRIQTFALHESLYASGRFGRKTGLGHYAYDSQGNKQAASADALSTVPPAAAALLAEDDAQLRNWLTERGWPVRAGDDGESPILAAPLGEDATAVAVRTGVDARRLVCLDLTGNTGKRVTVMTAPGADLAVRDAVIARLAANAAVTAIHDSPGFVAQRILAMIANLGCEIAQIGVASPADIDKAMMLALNYPQGPIALTDSLGGAKVLRILENLQRITGEPRYRPSQWLRRRALLGLPAATPD